MPTLSLTEGQLDRIAEKIHILRDPLVTRLPEPVSSTGTDSLAEDMALFGVPQMFPDIGIGLAFFPNNSLLEDIPNYRFHSPRIWLHNPGKVYRIGSTSKIAVLLAAVQLREDVRAIQGLGFLNSPEEYDELFAMKALWKRGGKRWMRAIPAGGLSPRISTIFNFPADGGPADFWGPNADSPDADAILTKLLPARKLSWESAQNFEFSERLWLAGAKSDNVAATGCVSEIGLGYIKAVQRAYGLCRDKPTTMRLLLSGGYTGMKKNRRVRSGSTPTYRPLGPLEVQYAEDVFKDPDKVHADHDSWVAGTAAALTAFMIALCQDRLAPSGSDPFSGATACRTIRANLAGGPGSAISFLADGVAGVSTVTRKVTKLGILDRLYADFAYLETVDRLTPEDKRMAYGLVVTNMTFNPMETANLTSRIHGALKSM